VKVMQEAITRDPFEAADELSQRVAKIRQPRCGCFCHNAAMTTKTIPAYLEDERQKGRDAQLRTEEETARIQPLHHGHHRTPKQSKLALPSRVEAVCKSKKQCRSSAEKARRLAQASNESPQGSLTPAALASRTRR
jgi:hypothetical protein